VNSAAVKADNSEVQSARARRVPVVRRAEMLAELMRLKWSIAVGGTHGKTTTTSLVAHMLDHADLDPTVINGGIINAYGTNARLGAGDWMVVEADESDGTFVKLPATIAVVTNMDPEHMDHYGSFDALRGAFDRFVENIPFYGFAALCIDHPEVQSMIARVSDRKIITYGKSPQADVRAFDIRPGKTGFTFNVEIQDRATGDRERVEDMRVAMLGEHNVMNALAAIVVGRELGIPVERIGSALESFEGVKRRFTVTGTVDGVTVVDDYGHHPVEIAAALKAARVATDNRVIAVVQPHRYTRLRDLFDDFCTCFNDADMVIVSDVHAAGEKPIPGFDRDGLVTGLRTHGHRDVVGLETPEDLAEIVSGAMQDGDLVICLGAGTITGWAHALPDQSRKLRAPGKAASG